MHPGAICLQQPRVCMQAAPYVWKQECTHLVVEGLAAAVRAAAKGVGLAAVAETGD